MASKDLYHGDFNISGEDAEEFAYAYTEGHALVEMARRIALDRGVNPGVIINYLRNHPHSYKIKLEQSACKLSKFMTADQQSSHTMATRQMSA